MSTLPIPGAKLDKRTPGDHLTYVRGRLLCCIDMIDAIDGDPKDVHKVSCWMVADELIACIRRLWEGCK